MLSEDDIVAFGSAIVRGEEHADRMINEARLGLTRILPHLSGATDILEVGAGHCILSAYLASKGFNVTAVEPMGDEFSFFGVMRGKVLDHCTFNGIALN